MSLTNVLQVVLKGCYAIAPLVRGFYQIIGSNTLNVKADKSIFTIADGAVQTLIFNYLLKGVFYRKIGEETALTNLTADPVNEIPAYTVDGLNIPAKFHTMIDRLILEMKGLTEEIKDSYDAYAAVLDPIDGTREFSTGFGEQCTICFGIVNKDGKSVGGLIFRPISDGNNMAIPETYAMGCPSEHFYQDTLVHAEQRIMGLLTSNGRVSPFLQDLIVSMQRLIPGFRQVCSGGAGNKILLLLAGFCSAYIQDRGLSNWDTAGAEAILEARAEKDPFSMGRLYPFLTDRTLVGYNYASVDENLSFIPGLAKLTAFNRASPETDISGYAMSINQVHPRANLQGLFAVYGDADLYFTGMQTISSVPEFD